jgi:hypothetical protein
MGVEAENWFVQARGLLAQQRAGFLNRHKGTVRKRELRREMSGPIAHLFAVGRVAATDNPDLGSTFRFKPSTSTSLAFQTAVDGMITAAQAHRELLVKHGLAAPMLDALVQMRDQYNAAVIQSSEGRSAHVAATRSLKKIATENRPDSERSRLSAAVSRCRGPSEVAVTTTAR